MKIKILSVRVLVFTAILLVITAPLIQASSVKNLLYNTLSFFGIIEITNANHLNSDRVIISDVYNEVKELDGVWSEEIYDGDYVRVKFEKMLASGNDITIYPRVIEGNPIIKVYEKDENDLIAEFAEINANEYNKAYLTNLQGKQDTFDLRVVGGSLEFEHIVDPVERYYLIGGHRLGGGANGTLGTTTGAATAIWETTASGQTYTWIKQYSSQVTLGTQTFTVGFWCNATASAGGSRVQVDGFDVFDCGTSSDCKTQDATICSATVQNVDCNSVSTATFKEISCTSVSGATLQENDYLGVRLTADINDGKTPDLRLHFNSTAMNSQVNITETADTCTYGGSGNWDLNCADNCVFATTQTIGNFDNVTVTGTGTLTFNSGGKWSFTGSSQYVTVASGCTLNIESGGGWDY